MEFHEKLQELRKQRGLTQEELAQQLYVSRTAISKWESGRGYPNIESLKAIAKLFSVTVDQLISGDALLTIAESEQTEKVSHIRDLVFGLLDVAISMLLFLPLFAQRAGDTLQEVALLNLTEISPYLRIVYFVMVALSTLWGVLMLTLQNVRGAFWLRHKYMLSLIISITGVTVFILSSQPYGAGIWFFFLVSKVLLLWKKG